MTSKKYVIQPVSLPPPVRIRYHHGSRTQTMLAKNSKSLHALGPSDLKKRDKEALPAILPCSISYNHKDFDYHRRSQTITVEPDTKEFVSPDLETDLRRYRDYAKHEEEFASSNLFVHPFQYIASDEEEEIEQAIDNVAIDFTTWIQEMNTKIITKKRQIRSDKKQAELAQLSTAQDDTASTITVDTKPPTPTPSPRGSPSSSPSSSPTASETSKKQRFLFQLGRKKKPAKTESESDNTGNSHAPPRRAMTAHNLPTSHGKDAEKTKISRVYSQQYSKSSHSPVTPINISALSSQSSSSSICSNSSSSSLNESPRLFEIVQYEHPHHLNSS